MRESISVLLVFFAVTGTAWMQEIETVVGGGPHLLPAPAVNLPGVNSIIVDAEGRLFLSSWVLHRVFVLDSSGSLRVVAGNGLRGFSGDEGSPEEARLDSPRGLALDGDGSLYIADSGNNRIRKVSLSDRSITTVAGTSESGFGGDGGPAREARLAEPTGVALDSRGNLYIADRKNNRIRVIDRTTGIIRTLAGSGLPGFSGDGGAATSAALSSPFDVAIDPRGNVLVSDTGNHRIRRVNASGQIESIAGNGRRGYSGDGGPAEKSSLNTPLGLTVDDRNNLFIADSGNNRVRWLDVPTGNIHTLAGSGMHDFSGDGSLPEGAGLGTPADVAWIADSLYIADSANRRVRRVDLTARRISTLAGDGAFAFSGDGRPAQSASLQQPVGLAVDSADNLYFTDVLNHRIRRVDARGGIETVAGRGLHLFGGDGGAADQSDLRSPLGLAFDLNRSLYVADTSNQRIRKLDLEAGAITTVAGNGSRAFSGDGGLALNASLSDPSAVAIDLEGNLLIADTSNHRVRKVDLATGIITTIAGNGIEGFNGDGWPAILAQLAAPVGLAVNSKGRIFISEARNHRVRQLDPASGFITTFAGSGEKGFNGDGGPADQASLASPEMIAFNPRGDLYISDYGNRRVRKVTSATGVISTVAGGGNQNLSGALEGPIGLAFDSKGDLYIADSQSHRVRRLRNP